MEVKKSPKVDLERRRGLFLEIGLALTLAFVFLAFEWSVDSSEATLLEDQEVEEIAEDAIPVTRQQPIKPPPPPPPAPKLTDIFEIVDDTEDIEDELEIEDSNDDIDADVHIHVEETIEVETDEQVFVVVEKMPQFPGGKVALNKWIANKVRYPMSASQNNVQGRVFVNFTVSRDGTIKNVKVTRGVDSALDKEAIRVVQAMPKWIPGEQRGRPVNVSFTVPINFRLE